VSDPQGLAEYILNKDGKPWTRKKINALISKGKRLVIPLKHPFPVHILYRTVFIAPNDGAVHFYDDIYGRDNLLAQALFTKGQPAQCRYNFH
jgi:murein L,D-transpeptidase YcbB/YkuD